MAVLGGRRKGAPHSGHSTCKDGLVQDEARELWGGHIGQSGRSRGLQRRPREGGPEPTMESTTSHPVAAGGTLDGQTGRRGWGGLI